jgi:hypothetical protein
MDGSAVKGHWSSSWVVYVNSLTQKCSLPLHMKIWPIPHQNNCGKSKWRPRSLSSEMTSPRVSPLDHQYVRFARGRLKIENTSCYFVSNLGWFDRAIWRGSTLMMSMGLDSTSEDTLLQCIMDPSHKSLAGGLNGDAVMKFIRRCIFRLQVQVMSTQCCWEQSQRVLVYVSLLIIVHIKPMQMGICVG